MALASVADVKRILRLTGVDSDRDAQLHASLAAVESWAESRLKHIGMDGHLVESFFDVYEDATLQIPALDGTVTLVQVFDYPSSQPVELEFVSMGRGSGYELTSDGTVILRPNRYFEPFEGAWAERPLKIYSRVDVHYEGSGSVPRAVTEGVALLAAGYWKDAPRLMNSLKSEKIGDYAYTVSDGGGDDEVEGYVKKALWFLGPFLGRKRRVLVT